MTDEIRRQLWVALAAGCVFFTALGSSYLWDEDEPKNAECAREMLAAGEWIVPQFNYQLRTDKPILLYWLMLAAYHTFGVGEFAHAKTCVAQGAREHDANAAIVINNPRAVILHGWPRWAATR